MRKESAARDMRQLVASLLGVGADTILDDSNLIELGLDSIGMMRLAASLRREGASIEFAQLAADPRVSAWQALLGASRGPIFDLASESASRAQSAVDPTAAFDLTPLQHAYWIGRRDDQVLGGVGCHAYFEFDRPADRSPSVDDSRLERAVHDLVRRHELLRARFLEEGKQQVLERSAWRSLMVHDLRTLSAEDASAALLRVREQLSHRRLDVEHGQVFDAQLSLLPGGATRIHLDVDLLVADVLSIEVMLADLAHLYSQPSVPLPPLEYGFQQYLVDQAALRDGDRQRAQAYWAARLAALPTGPQLPRAIEAEQIGRPYFKRRRFCLSRIERQRLEQRARVCGLTPAMVLLTAYAEVLSRWSAQKKFLLNLPLFDRHALHADVSRLVADFTSLVLLEVALADDEPFVEGARRIQTQLRRDVDHASYSGIEVLRDMTRARPDEAPAAPVVFACNLGTELVGTEFRRELGELSWMISQTPQVWLDHQVYESGGGLLLAWDAVEELFPPELLDAMFDAYQRLLRWLAAPESDWGAPTLELWPDAQRCVRARVNAEARRESGQCLHDAFFEQAARQPEAVALAWGDHGQLTYRELSERALRVAGWLVSRGLSPREPVAVTLPRGADAIVAVLAILAAGGAYVPVGIQQPAHRRERIYATAGVRWVIDELTEALSAPALDAPVGVGMESLAYVIFTSGSTGDPKGVEITHRAAVNTIEDINERFDVGSADRVLAVSALDFDLSVYDIFGLLGAGGAVVLVDEATRRDPYRWLDLARRHGVTIWNSVPTLFEMLLVASEGGVADSTASRQSGLVAGLRLVLLSGDWVGLDLPARLRAARPGCRFVALGGATEASIWSNVYEVDVVPAHWRSIPYGFPLGNQCYRVVDERGRDCPDWVAGELWIGGTGVALGYRGDAERTASKFVEHAGHRWYRTGDRGRYWPDGTLEFLGRFDQQVKIRGHRIELGEIEAALQAHPGVGRAIAVAIGDKRQRRLAVALTRAASGAPEGRAPALATDDVRAWLGARLPGAMLPEQLVVMGELPLTANGKLDRRAVERQLEAAARPISDAFEAPSGARETLVATIWAELLNVARIGRADSFFDLGGDSLLATRAAASLRAAGAGRVELAKLFASPVLADFAATLTLSGVAGRALPLVADPQRRNEPFPLTEVQQAYRLGQLPGLPLAGVGAHYYAEFDGREVDLGRLEEAFNRLVVRHEALRMVIDSDDQQRILPQVPRFEISVREVADSAKESAVLEALDALRAAMSHQVLDASRWPVFDIRAVRYGGGRTRIGFSLDNLVVDALSMMTLFAELDLLYCDPNAALPPVGMSFRDYVLQVRPEPESVSAAKDYWRTRIPTLPPAPRLPLARDPAIIEAPRFVRREARLSSEQWQTLQRKARRSGVTPSAVLLACYAEVLGAWSGRRDLSVVVTLFDRREVHPDIHRVVGDFTSLSVSSYEPVAGESWLESVRRLHVQQGQNLDHRDASGLWILRELARQAQAPTATIPVVFTSVLGLPGDLSVDVSESFPQQVWALTQTPQVWLDHKVYESQGGLSFDWDAVEELFPPGLLDAAFGSYCRLLSWFVESDWTEPLPPLLPSEQLAVRQRVNDTAGELPEGTLHAGFFSMARQAPDQPALIADGGVLSYGQLADRALRIASLLQRRGVAPGDAVAVTLPKGFDQVAALLGILAAGGVYVPVGVDQPEARQGSMYRSANVRIVMTEQSPDSPAGGGMLQLAVGDAEKEPPLPAPVAVPAGSLAYVIFTSGSTGDPKGVEIAHRSARNTIADINARFDVGATDRVLAVSALDFDLSVYDLFGLLSVGGAIVLIAESERRDARRWADLATVHEITIWNSVPMLLDMLLVASEGDELPPGLRLVLVSGDWVGLDLPRRVRAQRPHCRFVALGGATEASIWSNACEVRSVPDHWRSIPYGFPLRNQCYRVVDDRGRDCPDWVAGELWIGGYGVARGYRGDPEKTASKFVDHAGLRWYRTGDRGRYWPDGTLEFLGRVDHQVKIRGHRIELGEIEAVLQAHPHIQTPVVVAIGERGHQRLAAVVVPTRSTEPESIRAFLAERLPVHCIPEAVHFSQTLPLTANGKVDRRALEKAVAAARPDIISDTDDRPPRGPLENVLAGLWKEVLSLDGRAESLSVGGLARGHNFFALGGDSLLATRLLRTVQREFQVELPLREFFTTPTVAGLASAIEARIAPTKNTTADAYFEKTEPQWMEEGSL